MIREDSPLHDAKKAFRQNNREQRLQNTSQYNPQIRGTAKLCSHNSTEYRTQSGNIKELNHEYFPGRQRDIVYSIGFGKSRGFTVVRTKDALHQAPIREIACYQRQQAQGKCNHGVLFF